MYTKLLLVVCAAFAVAFIVVVIFGLIVDWLVDHT